MTRMWIKLFPTLEMRNHEDYISPSQKSSEERRKLSYCNWFALSSLYYHIKFSKINKYFLYTEKRTTECFFKRREEEIEGQRKRAMSLNAWRQSNVTTSAGECRGKSVVRFTGKRKVEFWGWTTGWVHMVSKIITGDGRGWDEKGNSMSSAATSSEDKTCCKINCF